MESNFTEREYNMLELALRLHELGLTDGAEHLRGGYLCERIEQIKELVAKVARLRSEINYPTHHNAQGAQIKCS